MVRQGNQRNKAGGPTKCVESMSWCTPIIATLTSNIGDYLKDGVNGFVVSDDNPLSSVFDLVASLPSEKVLEMKKECRMFKGFDYRRYKNEFMEICK